MGKKPKKNQWVEKSYQLVLKVVDDNNLNTFMFSDTSIYKATGDRDKYSNSFETSLSDKGRDVCTKKTLNEEPT